MANRVSVEITANTTGYKNAVDEAKGANQQFQSSIKNIDIKGLNREFRESGKGARGLALELYKLEKAGKIDTTQYRQLQRELIRATKDAAELTDVVNDTNAKIRMLSSDTLNLDTFKEGVSIFRDIGSAAAALGIENEGIEAGLTRLAQIQTVANAAISISNALNKDGLIIGRIKIMQDAALAKAIDLETAATGRATIAQRIFNAVAKMNPYVLLASAVLGVAAAFGTYIALTNKTISEEQKQQEELKKEQAAWKEKTTTVNNSVASNLAEYMKLRAEWQALSSEHEKSQWIDKNSSKFKTMGLNVKDAKAAEDIFINNTSAVIAALKARYEAEAWGELYKKQIETRLQNDLNGTVDNGRYYKVVKEGQDAMKAITAEEAKQLGITRQISTTMSTSAGVITKSTNTRLTKEQAIAVNTLRQANAVEKQRKEREEEKKILDKMTGSYQTAITKQKELGNLMTSNTSGEGKGNTNKDKPNIDYKTDSLEDLEKQLTDLQNKRKKGLLPELNTEEYIEKVKNLKTNIEKKKIELGIELPKTELEEISEKIDTLKANQLRVETRLDSQQYQQELKRLENEEQEIKIKIGLEVEPSAFEKISKVIADKLNTFNIPIEFNPNAEPSKLQKMKRELEQYTYIQENVALSDEDLAIIKEKIKDLKSDIEQEEIRIGIAPVKNEAVSTREDKISGLRDKATSIMNANGGMPEPNTDAYQQLLEIFKQIRDTQVEINALQEPLAAAEAEHNKQLEKRSKTMNDVSKAIGNIGSAMASLADEEDKGTQAAAIIVQAIANVIAGYASASAEAGGTLGPWGWAAFSIAGLAQVAATIAQIKSLSAGSYATGGFIPGTSYSGDRLWARVNSGEAILNTQQQKRFMDIANGLYGPYGPEVAGPQQVVVTGEIDGTKLLLVQRNVNKVRNKSGNAITF